MARKDRHKPTPVTCPECGQGRTVQMETFLNPNFTGICGICAKTGKGKKPSAKKIRRCLKCDATFESSGPWNRLCRKHAETNSRTNEEEFYSIISYGGGAHKGRP